MSDYEDFEKFDTGAAGCTPTQAGSIKKGGYCMLNGFPCKVSDFSTAKPGKHGAAKATIIGYDIFTGKRHEQISPTSGTVQVPDVIKTDYEVGNVAGDDFVSLIMENGILKEDLKLPNDEEMKKELRQLWEDNLDINQVYYTVISAVGQEKIISGKTKDN